ncbi:MAG: DUF4212 domain-containing protein [Betaproteobacteria bacterium]|nr:DUF4212 domain-containing protein [Betaproteobacteria bacterium]
MTGSPEPNSTEAKQHWRKTLLTTSVLLILWLLVTLITSLAPKQLNQWSILGFPLGFYLAAQGTLLIYLAIIAVHTILTNRLDRKYQESSKTTKTIKPKEKKE